MAEVPDVVHAPAPMLSHHIGHQLEILISSRIFNAVQPTAQDSEGGNTDYSITPIRPAGSPGFDANLAFFIRAL